MAPTTTKEQAMIITTNKANGICADIFLGLREWKKQAESVCDVNEIDFPMAADEDASKLIVTDTDGRSYEVIVKPI
jgi:hypothetical protein